MTFIPLRHKSIYQASETHYRTVFENTATTTFVKENDLIISMVDTGFEFLMGYSKKQIENRIKWADIRHPDGRSDEAPLNKVEMAVRAYDP